MQFKIDPKSPHCRCWAATLAAMVAGAAPAAAAAAAPLALEQVDAGVYAVVGPLGDRTPENLANNATFGFVVTPEGVVVIDPGGSERGAAALHALIRGVTDRPVRVVINTGGQDHRWLGNGYFRRLGARVLASRAAVADQQARARDQLVVLNAQLGTEALQGTEPVHADETFDAAMGFTLGGTRFELRHVGPAHTPGDSLVWLPAQRIVFSGDVVYTERMLGVLPVSKSANWIKAFGTMAALEPRVLVPGHGRPTTLARARADTYDYLVFLRAAVGRFRAAGGGIEAIGGLDQSRFRHLANYELLKGRNAQQVYDELEWE
jgi:glyoxylase-like metal-dependent hydrolase (beta-lactamase superfamily II)